MAKKKKKPRKKKVRKIYTSEPQLYTKVDLMFRKDRTDPKKAKDLDYPVEYVLREIYRRRLHILKEKHGSRKPTDYTHEHLVPLIEADPGSWVLLVESRERTLHLRDKEGYILYFNGLAEIFDLPIGEALESIHDEKTREYLEREWGVTTNDIDRIFLYDFWGGTFPGRAFGYKVTAREIRHFAGILNKPIGRIEELFRMPPIARDRNHLWGLYRDTLGTPWNTYSRTTLRDRLEDERYEGRENFLVLIGSEHIDAFEEI